MNDINFQYGKDIEYILGKNFKKLLRETSDFNFIDIKDQLLKVWHYTAMLKDNPEFWQEIPLSHKRSLAGALEDMRNRLSDMSDFDTKLDNPWERLVELKNNFENIYNGFYEQIIIPLDIFLSKKAYDSGFRDSYTQKAKTSLSEINSVLKNLESIEARANEAAAVASNVATTAHAQSFSTQAAEHKRSAKKWILAVCVLGIAGVSILAWIASEVTDLSDGKLSVVFFALKLPLLALSYLGLRFSIKNYSAHQHLYVINKQRSNVLNSIEAFMEGAKDEKTRHAVLLAGVGAAFSHQETGFITTREGAGSEDQNLIDVVKAASSK